MKNIQVITLAFLLCLPILTARANWSGNITLVNDYLFNGISQTQGELAAQAGITWSTDNGFYLSSWASNVDYGQQANFELDGYIGFYHSINKSVAMDLGISQYTYHGSGSSSKLDFPESYLKWKIGNSQVNFWYSWDYFGTGARHFIMMATHSFMINDKLSFSVSVDKSRSLDKDKWLWEPDNDKDYLHGYVSVHYQFQHFDFSLALHATDIDKKITKNFGDSQILLSISRSFGG